MASKFTAFNGIMEKIVLKAISRLTFDTNGLRVSNTPQGTQTISGTVSANQGTVPWAVTEGAMTQNATSQVLSQQNMQISFRRNLVVS
jgi:hypothetical protein